MTPRSVVQAVAYGLVGAMILALVGMIVLTVLQRAIPDILANTTSVIVGAVAGLLARTGSDPAPDDPPADGGEVSLLGVLLTVLVVLAILWLAARVL